MQQPYDPLAAAADEHLRLALLTSLAQLLAEIDRNPAHPAHHDPRLEFLAEYRTELARGASAGMQSAADWRDALANWERQTPLPLPLRSLREAWGLTATAVAVWMCVGLLEEDPRFGVLFEEWQGLAGQRRPTLGLLASLWPTSARDDIAQLLDLGLLQLSHPDAPRMEWALQVEPHAWEALRNDPRQWPWPGTRLMPTPQLPALDNLVLPAEVREQASRLAEMVTAGTLSSIVVRGGRWSGRRTLLAAVAREAGLGVLHLAAPPRGDDPRWNLLEALCVARRLMPVALCESAPGESRELPWSGRGGLPLGLACGRQGGLTGPALQQGVTLELPAPTPDLRHRLWSTALPATDSVERLANRFRLGAGAIQRVADLARRQARLAGRAQVELDDVVRARRELSGPAIEALARRLPALGDAADLAVSPAIARELDELRARCRHRETLRHRVGATLGARLGAGVRALFSGASGTGKTLAARVLAHQLGYDLHRLDLGAIVSKYIGETEKNLDQVLTLAEDLDIMLLIDEGETLLGGRTAVNNATDRFANHETNFLLQRLEDFEGIVVITTNAADRIDSAFARRMDVSIEFRAPEPRERLDIWLRHLPADHAIAATDLERIASLCDLTGGQIRNVVLRAAVETCEGERVLDLARLETAVQREYRKMGTASPLGRGRTGATSPGNA